MKEHTSDAEMEEMKSNNQDQNEQAEMEEMLWKSRQIVWIMIMILSLDYGSCGGIWCFWRKEDINIETIPSMIIMRVKQGQAPDWLILVVYALANQKHEEELWAYLRALGQAITHFWMIVGNFNQVLEGTENIGGANNWRHGVDLFWKGVEDFAFIDLDFLA
ncbi:hypothetical protein M9H77_09066 [Catharanthus roseus]|uniref:Uncharacterized protein n=1 Tax=Catharanthus roseus TaxID=4058 RepID=A0ACC0BZZ1_CATRO|nr:hypothetical protein M9H77_09066 [Catharanthus roseus]